MSCCRSALVIILVHIYQIVPSILGRGEEVWGEWMGEDRFTYSTLPHPSFLFAHANVRLKSAFNYVSLLITELWSSYFYACGDNRSSAQHATWLPYPRIWRHCHSRCDCFTSNFSKSYQYVVKHTGGENGKNT